MIIKIFCGLLGLFALSCQAQQSPDAAQLSPKNDSTTPYSTLLKRWQARDSSLNMQECRSLYYKGPATTLSDEDRHTFAQLKQQAQDSKITPDALKKAMNDTDAYLQKHPFDLEMMEFQIHFLHLYGVPELRKRSMVLQGKMTQAVLSSGQGQSCAQALRAHKIQAIDYWLSLLDLEMTSSSLESNCLKIKLKANKNGLDYFFVAQF
jgi:Domain of unknown function (DUF4919)